MKVARWFAPRRKAATVGADLAAIIRASSGTNVAGTPERATAMPAALQSVRLIAETAAMLPVHVYKNAGGYHERADNTALSRMLRREPAPSRYPVDWRSDAVASAVGFGNFYARKVRGRSGVRWLLPLDPRSVRAMWSDDDGPERIVYDVAPVAGGAPERLERADIFHVRGFTLHGEAEGLSPVGVCRRALATGLQLERFLERFASNGAAPGGVLEFPGTVTEEKAREIVDVWKASHGGENAGGTAVLGGGATWRAVGMSLVDAQFIESQRFTVEQVARIFNLPAAFLAGKPSRDDYEWFVTFTLGPWLARFDSAFSSDPDLCPEDSGLFVEHKADALLRPSPRDRMAAYKDARQGGWISANEIRRLENLPPVAGGDEIQITPVGGAPNARPSGGDPGGGDSDA